MQILYVNLESRPERNERFLRTNSAVADFRRFPAVDGKGLRVESLIAEGFIREPLPAYTAGALGCALSHRTLWTQCFAEGRAVTVAEDDAVFNQRFATKATAVLARLPADWDIILWGWNFDSILQVAMMEGLAQAFMQFHPWMLGPNVSEFREQDYDVLPLRLQGAFGLVCYAVSPKGAQQLLRLCFPLPDEMIPVPGLGRMVPNCGIDVLLNKYYPALKAYVAFPPLVWTENDKSISDVSAAT